MPSRGVDLWEALIFVEVPGCKAEIVKKKKGESAFWNRFTLEDVWFRGEAKDLDRDVIVI